VVIIIIIIIIIKQTLKAQNNRKRTSQMHHADIATEKIVFMHHVYVSMEQQCLEQFSEDKQ